MRHSMREQVWLVMAIITFILLLGFNGERVGCLNEEREALNYPNDHSLFSWNNLTPFSVCCTWESVQCDDSTHSASASGCGWCVIGNCLAKNSTNPNTSASAAASDLDDKIVKTTNLKKFRLEELKIATRNFRPDTVVGEGSFGRVFKGWIDPNTLKPSKVGFGIPVAVQRSNPNSLQGLKEWQNEVKFLRKFSHRNVVKLIGYYWDENQLMLVYEYVQKGSLENHLFRRGSDPLAWDIRLKIAIGAARGLAFLHASEKSVIYRDFKSSNILLDGEFNAKLSDFGLATTGVKGNYGHAAPEYIASGHLYVKSDVYGFGVVLLEILTGLVVLDPYRPGGEESLVHWKKPYLSHKERLTTVIDPKLGGKYPLSAAFNICQLILKCLEPHPTDRPSMQDVLITLERAYRTP